MTDTPIPKEAVEAFGRKMHNAAMEWVGRGTQHPHDEQEWFEDRARAALAAAQPALARAAVEAERERWITAMAEHRDNGVGACESDGYEWPCRTARIVDVTARAGGDPTGKADQP